MSRQRGMTLLELLVGMTLGMVGLAAMTALVRVGTAAWERAGARAEAATEIAAAADQVIRDLRLAGYDPRVTGVAGLTIVEADRVELTADLDGNGAIDADSEERIGYRWSAGSRSLQRIVGRQTLPILSDVTPGGFRLAYLDASGAVLDPRAPATAASTRVVTVDLTTSSPGTTATRIGAGARLVNR